MPKQVYQIDPVTREFIGYAMAFENPMVKSDGIPFNIPRGCVEDAPPAAKDGFAIVREGALWIYVKDYRGQTMYATADRSPVIIDFLGPIPEGYTLAEPGPFSIWQKTKWVVDAAAKTAAEKEANNAAIKAELVAVDMASIRAIREWLAAQPNAPKFVIEHEKEAQEKRKKLT